MNLKSLLMFTACFSLLTVDGSCMQGNSNYNQIYTNFNPQYRQQIPQQQARSQRSNAMKHDRRFQQSSYQQHRQGIMPHGTQFNNQQMPGIIPSGQQFRQQGQGTIPPGQQFRQQGQGMIPPCQQFRQQGQGFPQYGMQQQRPSNSQIKTTPTTPMQNIGKRQMNNMKPYRSSNIMQNQQYQQFAPGNSAYGMQYQ